MIVLPATNLNFRHPLGTGNQMAVGSCQRGVERGHVGEGSHHGLRVGIAYEGIALAV